MAKHRKTGPPKSARRRTVPPVHQDLQAAVGRFLEGGEITPEEVHWAVHVLQGGKGNRFLAMKVIGYAQQTQHESLLAGFLDSEDEHDAAMALRVLCNYWCMSEKYRDHIYEAIKPPSAETDDDLDDGDWMRIVGMSLAGEHLREHEDLELLVRVYSTFKDTDRTTSDRIIAYQALMTAFGIESRQKPDLSDAQFERGEGIDTKIIEWAERKLAE